MRCIRVWVYTCMRARGLSGFGHVLFVGAGFPRPIFMSCGRGDLAPTKRRRMRFYSKLVRLEEECLRRFFASDIAFLFQTGAIRREWGRNLEIQDVRFLFQTGAIRRHPIGGNARFGSLCFYSKLVRLEVTYTSECNTCDQTKFLFQTGAIRSPSQSKIELFARRFYSKLVRLEAILFIFLMEQWRSFYSKLVRLEVKPPRNGQTRTSQFLFQTGAIRSKGRCNVMEVNE